MMAKRLGTTYHPGTRSKDWRKVKNRQPRRGRHRRVHRRARQSHVELRGAARRTVATGDGRLAFAGGVGTGFTQRRLEELTRGCATCAPTSARSTRHRRRPYRRGATWVEPVLRAIVEITEFTNEGYVRQASFVDLDDMTGFCS